MVCCVTINVVSLLRVDYASLSRVDYASILRVDYASLSRGRLLNAIRGRLLNAVRGRLLNASISREDFLKLHYCDEWHSFIVTRKVTPGNQPNATKQPSSTSINSRLLMKTSCCARSVKEPLALLPQHGRFRQRWMSYATGNH